jgi:hypothetical protein
MCFVLWPCVITMNEQASLLLTFCPWLCGCQSRIVSGPGLRRRNQRQPLEADENVVTIFMRAADFFCKCGDRLVGT